MFQTRINLTDFASTFTVQGSVPGPTKEELLAHINQQFDTNLNMGGDSASSDEEDDSSPPKADPPPPAKTHVYGHGLTITEEVGPVLSEGPSKKARRADSVTAEGKAEAKVEPVPAKAKGEAKAEPKKLSLR